MVQLFEYVKLAYRNIRGNLLRTVLTCLIIAFGIMALVGIQTVISSLKNQASDVFSPLGTNQFSIVNQDFSFQSSSTKKVNPAISYEEANSFKELMTFPSRISISATVKNGQELRSSGKKTNPTYAVIAGDEYYLELNNQEIETGRGFSFNELQRGENVAIITSSLQKKLFPDLSAEGVLDQMVIAAGVRYRIVGLLKDKGQGFGGTSSFIFIPLQNAVKFFATPKTNYTIKIGVNEQSQLTAAREEAKGVMRAARKLQTTEEDDFVIEDPSAAGSELVSLLKNVTMGGLLIGIITLAGAAVGLMNILLVSVTERIREIGISKAIGATVLSIRLQYFVEGMLISLFGGFLGILLGLLAGFLVAMVLKTRFTIPWDWIIIGMVVCLFVGLLSSIYPAIKASRLNPINALRQG